MLKNGNICPDGPTVQIKNKNIKLKHHQQRMVYEMIQRENINYRLSNGINAFVLCDKVGSGKSIDILSLISILSNNSRTSF
jgi:ABC-type microcin C transport system duplicated ATPase subunit YejF